MKAITVTALAAVILLLVSCDRERSVNVKCEGCGKAYKTFKTKNDEPDRLEGYCSYSCKVRKTWKSDGNYPPETTVSPDRDCDNDDGNEEGQSGGS